MSHRRRTGLSATLPKVAVDDYPVRQGRLLAPNPLGKKAIPKAPKGSVCPMGTTAQP
jgi:hypothetical protein